MATNPTNRKRSRSGQFVKQATPLREVVAANLRSILETRRRTAVDNGKEPEKLAELADRMGVSRQWVYRRTVPIGPITTDDIDSLAEALEISTDSLTRRPE